MTRNLQGQDGTKWWTHRMVRHVEPRPTYRTHDHDLEIKRLESILEFRRGNEDQSSVDRNGLISTGILLWGPIKIVYSVESLDVCV